MPSSSRKPYRVYRQPRRVRGDGSIPWDDSSEQYRASGPGGGSPRGPRRRQPRPTHKPWWKRLRRPFRYLRRACYVIVGLIVIWAIFAFIHFSGAMHDANKRLPKNVAKVLSPANGPAITSATNTLLMGSDTRGGNYGPGHSDSILLVHSDPGHRRFSMLSIPRDLRVAIPGHGTTKINAAYTLGGPALAIRTVHKLTGLPINHVAVIDFMGFRDLVDALGGINVDNAHRIHSEPFDGREWIFPKGNIHLTGKRALAYSRVRKNILDPRDSDLTRVARQQQVINAIVGKLTSFHTVLHTGSVLDAAVKPLTTDLSASEMVELAMSRTWGSSSNALQCRLGGIPETVDGADMLVGSEANRATVRMFLGKQNPLPPNLKENLYAPGCTK